MHECSFCKRTFCNKSNLNRHLQTAKGCKYDVKKYMFVCEKCSDEDDQSKNNCGNTKNFYNFHNTFSCGLIVLAHSIKSFYFNNLKAH